MNCIEKHFKESTARHFNDRHVIYARVAHLTQPQPIHLEQGRVQCQNRTLCQRGCPFGGYFSSNSSTLPWAQKTGNLTLRSHAVVQSILYNEQKGKATGVRVIDAVTKQTTDYFAPVIFINAGAINTNAVLLNSVSNRFPNGLGNDNGLLGKFFAFHNYRGRVSAQCNSFMDSNAVGRSPSCAYIPRFRNMFSKENTGFLRGYASVVSAHRPPEISTNGFGTQLKEQLSSKELQPWQVSAQFMGETIPKETNQITLNKTQKDEWGMPAIQLNVSYDDNDEKMLLDFFEQMTNMFTKAGFTNIKTTDSGQAPGLDIHEMGGVRMGNDPATSLLNKWNQLHTCKNVYVTDGACMTSTSTQNPSLTYMAMTARAVNHAVEELKENRL